MVHALKTWFARQSLTVKLIVAVPVLVAAVLWSLVPEQAPPAPGGLPSSRPVLSSESPSAAATVAPHEEPRAADSGLSWISAIRAIVSIGVVVALIVLSARALRYVMSSAGQLPGATGTLKVVETTYLPSPNGRGRAAIHLVQTTDGRQLLIGATDTQISLLAEYEEGARLKTVSSELESLPEVPSTPASSDRTAGDPVPARFDEVLERLRQSARTLERAR